MIKTVLGIEPGITAVIGSGGKTSLIERLAGELCDKRENKTESPGESSGRCHGNVVICTTTHILKPEGMPVYVPDFGQTYDEEGSARSETDKVRESGQVYDKQISARSETDRMRESGQICDERIPARSESGRTQCTNRQQEPGRRREANREKETKKLRFFLEQHKGSPVCVGTTDPDNMAKLISYPIDIIREAAGEDACILVEADGAKHLPMKAHNDREPVIPDGCGRVILVIGAEGFGKPVSEAVHRPEIFAKLAGVDSTEVVKTDMLARVLLAERPKFGDGRLQVLVNRTEYRDMPERENTDEDKDTVPHRETGSVQYLMPSDIRAAEQLARLTGWEVYAGNVRKGVVTKL